MLKINFKDIEMNFGKTQVLKKINLTIEPGEFVTFVGPSGCGKTTLLRILAGLLHQTNGELYFDDQEVSSFSPIKRGIAMVFQSYALYPHLNVYNNIALGLKQKKIKKEIIEEKVNKTVKMLKIENLLKRYPSELSGGQRQRVAIGRAIAREPQVLLLDEPLSNLDASLRFSVRLEISNLHRKIAATTVYVTHDQVEAMTLSDKIVIINKGKIEQSGKPLELYLTPCNRFVAGFLGTPKMNFVEVHYDSQKKQIILPNQNRLDWKHAFQNLQDKKLDKKKMIFGFRPEHAQVHLASKKSNHSISGKIIDIENMGSEIILVINYNYSQSDESSQLITLKTPGFQGFKINDIVKIIFDGNGYLFDPENDDTMVSCPKKFYQYKN